MQACHHLAVSGDHLWDYLPDRLGAVWGLSGDLVSTDWLSVRPISLLRFSMSEGLTQQNLNLSGGILMSIEISPEVLSQQILVGIILVGRLGVLHESRECRKGADATGAAEVDRS